MPVSVVGEGGDRTLYTALYYSILGYGGAAHTYAASASLVGLIKTQNGTPPPPGHLLELPTIYV